MQTEIEIKFFVSQDIQQPLSKLLNSLEIISSSQVELGNVYFDTPTLDLRQLEMGLRIRRSDDFAEQTIKCRGQVVGGLHARPEYNAPVHGDVPLLAAFPVELWPSVVVRDEIQGKLVAQFRTDFLRRHWLVAFEGAEIELAWDQGEIVGSLGKTCIDELELELKSGDARALFGLAEQLAGLGGVRLGAQSKAQRGYRLAGLGKPLALQSLPVANGVDAAMRITAGLQHWQHHEQYWLEQADSEPRRLALQEIRQGVAFIVEAAAPRAPVWLATLTDLSTHLALLAQAPADTERQAALSMLFHRADYVRLQLAIAAWLHAGA
ncbi:CYTH domain-containing protein [Aeromonas piscicola]|uniref:CYTH domain-containing protein n=1 Tax=Aeromonas piscicola TaxID=600645 RepID=A0ABT7QF27_9GAMM|nr:CYTH domain-containing protein [Aeromonas piscicola]MDM5132546.1 CYTH domain-containing protein [Aeromonas piscicola]